MKERKKLKMVLSISMACILICALYTVAFASDADYKYEINGESVTITKYLGNEANVIIPDTISGKTVTSIQDYAFLGNDNIHTITIPDSVNYVGGYFVADCNNVTVINVGSGVTDMNLYCDFGNAPYVLRSLTDINVSDDNEVYCSVDGILFSKDKSRLLKYPTARQGAYIVPNSVVDIDTAFAYCDGITSLEVSDGVSEIKDLALISCVNLKYLSIPSSVENIGRLAAYACMKLEIIDIAEGVKTIGDESFYACDSLRSVFIPSTVKDISTSAFAYSDFDDVERLYDFNDFTVLGYSGTAAERFAKDVGVNFIEVNFNGIAQPVGSSKGTIKVSYEKTVGEILNSLSLYNNKASIVVTDNNGTIITDMNTKVEEGMIFTATTESGLIRVYEISVEGNGKITTVQEITTNKNVNIPKTGETVSTIPAIVVVLAMSGAVVGCIKKKRK